MLNVSDVVQNLSGYVEHILVGEMQDVIVPAPLQPCATCCLT